MRGRYRILPINSRAVRRHIMILPHPGLCILTSSYPAAYIESFGPILPLQICSFPLLELIHTDRSLRTMLLPNEIHDLGFPCYPPSARRTCSPGMRSKEQFNLQGAFPGSEVSLTSSCFRIGDSFPRDDSDCHTTAQCCRSRAGLAVKLSCFDSSAMTLGRLKRCTAHLEDPSFQASGWGNHLALGTLRSNQRSEAVVTTP